jgi:hypothetical protein
VFQAGGGGELAATARLWTVITLQPTNVSWALLSTTGPPAGLNRLTVRSMLSHSIVTFEPRLINRRPDFANEMSLHTRPCQALEIAV